ncbi:calcium-binding protein [Microvirga sp. TS319]|uniref:calcium-binding protein n=1 Tax=Microvirga sp. TS319 TaxID=3241165 RepID=UPI00351A0F97
MATSTETLRDAFDRLMMMVTGGTSAPDGSGWGTGDDPRVDPDWEYEDEGGGGPGGGSNSDPETINGKLVVQIIRPAVPTVRGTYYIDSEGQIYVTDYNGNLKLVTEKYADLFDPTSKWLMPIAYGDRLGMLNENGYIYLVNPDGMYVPINSQAPIDIEFIEQFDFLILELSPGGYLYGHTPIINGHMIHTRISDIPIPLDIRPPNSDGGFIDEEQLLRDLPSPIILNGDDEAYVDLGNGRNIPLSNAEFYVTTSADEAQDGIQRGVFVIRDADALYLTSTSRGTAGRDVIVGAGVISGEAGDDSVKGSVDSDILGGGDGNDVLNGGAGGDLLSGGAGIDTVDYSTSPLGINGAGIHVNLSTGVGTNSDAHGDRLFDIENVIGSAGNDFIKVGNANPDDFDAADYLGKNPDVAAWIAHNHLPPSEAYEHWKQAGRFEGREGGWHGAMKAVGADWGGVFDAESYLAANPDVANHIIDNGLDNSYALQHWLVVGRDEGREGGVEVSGSILSGRSGSDVIVGGVYSDALYGGTGADTLYGHDGQDVLLGGAGSDSLDGGAGNDQVFGGHGDDTLSGGSGADSVIGGAGNDGLSGGDGQDSLEGGAGNDGLNGGDGNDLMRGDSGDDYLDGDNGNDSLIGGDGNDFATGWFGNDVLRGEAGSDTLYGWDGDDTLQGGSGLDVLYGGAGRDTFVFNLATDRDAQSNPAVPVVQDRIMDFGSGDRLEIVGASSVTFARQMVITWSGVTPVITYDTNVLINGSSQIVLKGFGGDLVCSGGYLIAA